MEVAPRFTLLSLLTLFDTVSPFILFKLLLSAQTLNSSMYAYIYF